MNAMIGDAGELSDTGANENNPNYVQFFRITDIPRPADIFVFVEEHPDSINDGSFFNAQRNPQWIDLPSNQHNNACGFAFADGHSEIHKWRSSVSKYPVKLVDWARTPVSLQDADFSWILERTSYR